MLKLLLPLLDQNSMNISIHSKLQGTIIPSSTSRCTEVQHFPKVLKVRNILQSAGYWLLYGTVDVADGSEE